jgi:hypothetical protein
LRAVRSRAAPCDAGYRRALGLRLRHRLWCASGDGRPSDPGLPELREESKALAPLRKAGEALNTQLNALKADDPARKELMAKIKENFGQQLPLNKKVKEMADTVQFHQEIGGLIGRILLAILLIVGISRVALLKVFQIPALIVLPVTYFYFFEQGGNAFLWAYGICGLLTVAQFSYFGEYLPKVFPMHLRGTGGSFATNVGGRMIGTSMAFVTTNLVAPMLAGSGPLLPLHVAKAAGIVASVIVVHQLRPRLPAAGAEERGVIRIDLESRDASRITVRHALTCSAAALTPTHHALRHLQRNLPERNLRRHVCRCGRSRL